MGMPIVPQRTPCERLHTCWYVKSHDLRRGYSLTTPADRELILVPKKGRPVTQCHHCRQERKKRSAHVSCDCAQPEKQLHSKEKCIHLREAEEKAKVTAGTRLDDLSDKDPAHLARIAEEQGCCCGHGGRCTCALLMNEPGDGSLPHGPAVKPKLEKATSEGSITVFQNGHHKPVHRKNHAAHECGMPYKVPMPRPPVESNVSAAARRSFESLALDTYQTLPPSAYLPLTSAPFNTERRKSKSEQPSPKIAGMSDGMNDFGEGKLANLDFSTLSQTQTNQSVQSATSASFGIPSFDPVSGVADSSYDPWSAFPSADSMTMPNNNPFTVWPTSTDNMHLTQPALTAASSGTTSEIDEIPAIDDNLDYMPSISEDPMINFPNLATGNSPQFNRRSLPPGFFGNADFGAGAGAVSSEWTVPEGNFSTASMDKTQMQQNRQPTSFDQAWQMTDIRPLTNTAARVGGPPSGTRPQSRSFGPSSAPNDDIIKQLFPDIDINGSMFGNSLQVSNLATPRSTNRMQQVNPTSAPLDFGPMDESSNGFTAQRWSDGSMTIPSDLVTSSYNDFSQDYSNPDFAGNWSQ